MKDKYECEIVLDGLPVDPRSFYLGRNGQGLLREGDRVVRRCNDDRCIQPHHIVRYTSPDALRKNAEKYRKLKELGVVITEEVGTT